MKKLFISADIEGTCGIAAWQETNIGTPYSEYFLTQMSNEVASAARGATEAGYEDIIIKDAHDSARNIYPNLLPKNVRIIRNWTMHPYCMMAGIDRSFDAAIFTGYHSPGNSSGSPLAHTMTTNIFSVHINGKKASEFMLNSLIAAYEGVPSVMITGDEYICEQAKEFVPAITTVPVNCGMGGASMSIHPTLAKERIEAAAKKALSGTLSDCFPKMPDSFRIEVVYKNQEEAYRCSFFPGATLADSNTVVFESHDFMTFMSFNHFCI